jgi:hypothetical protein
MRFLLGPGTRRLRWIRLREALLVALRSLVLFLIACALLRPTASEEREVAGASGLRRGVVLVVDTSPSMAYRAAADSPSVFERARSRCEEVLSGLGDGDLAVVLTPAEAGGAERPLPPLDARRAVLALALGRGRFVLSSAIESARTAASRLPAASVEVVVISDFQASAVVPADAAHWRLVAARFAEHKPQPRLVLVDCGAPEPRNHYVAAIERDDLLVTRGADVAFRARIGGIKKAAEPFAVRLFVDGRLAEETSVSPVNVVPPADQSKPPAPVEARSRATATSSETGTDEIEVEFRPRFEADGRSKVRVELAADGLEADDALDRAVVVHDRVDVLVVESPPLAGEPAGSGSGRYVDLALLPPASDGARSSILDQLPFRPARAAEVKRDDVAKALTVVLADVERVGEDGAQLLEAHLRRGGGVVVFAGARADAVKYSAVLVRSGQGLLPAELVSRRSAAPQDSFQPGELLTTHPALSLFRDPRQGDLGRVEVRHYWETFVAEASAAYAGPSQPAATVLARIEGGGPWILERRFGQGRVILVTTSAEPDDSTLPRTPLFVPLLHRMVLAAASALSDAAEDEVQPGLPRPKLPPEESRLERADGEAIEGVAAALGAALVCEGDELPRAAHRVRSESELWPHALGLALLCLFVELVVVRRLARGRVLPSLGRGSDPRSA